MLRRRTAWMLAVPSVMLVASMGLTGCGPDNPAPKPFNPPKAPSVSGSALSDSPPTMPEAAKQNNAAGAKAFVRYYFEVASYVENTGNTSAIKPLGDKDCRSCNFFAESVDKTYRAGGHSEGKGSAPTDLKLRGKLDDRYRFDGKLVLFPQQTVHSEGAPPSSVGREVKPLQLVVERTATQEWAVLEWSLQ